MRVTRLIKRFIVGTACLGMLVPQLAYGESTGPTLLQLTKQKAKRPATKITDVQLRKGGVLTGHVLDAQGKAQPNMPVAMVRSGKLVAQAKTDDRGRFNVRGLKGGVYRLASLNGTKVYRVWTPQTAPPTATDSAVLVNRGDIVRGQGGTVLGMLGNPWIVGAIIATAIAVPVAIEADDDDDDHAS